MTVVTLSYSDRRAIQTSIESAGAMAARAEEEAAKRIVKAQWRTTEEVVALRTDMLEGFDAVCNQVARSAHHIGAGISVIAVNQLATMDALRSLGATGNVINRNIVQGFSETFARLDRIHASLEQIHGSLKDIQEGIGQINRGIENPEATKALERYRRARGYLQQGEVGDALSVIEIAIANDGGHPLTDMPVLMIFRGLIRLGLYDTPQARFQNFPIARHDFEKAILFTPEPSLVLTLKDKLALACFHTFDYETAQRLYRDVEKDPAARMRARFERGKCLLGMGLPGDAEELLLEVLTSDPAYVVEAAADPFCQSHAQVFKAIGLQVKARSERDARRKREEEAREERRRQAAAAEDEARRKAAQAEAARSRMAAVNALHQEIETRLAWITRHDPARQMRRAKELALKIYRQAQIAGPEFEDLRTAMIADGMASDVLFAVSVTVDGLPAEQQVGTVVEINDMFKRSYQAFERANTGVGLFPLQRSVTERVFDAGFEKGLGEQWRRLAGAASHYRDAVSILHIYFGEHRPFAPRAASPKQSILGSPEIPMPTRRTKPEGFFPGLLYSETAADQEYRGLLAKREELIAKRKDRTREHYKAFLTKRAERLESIWATHGHELGQLHEAATAFRSDIDATWEALRKLRS